MSHDLSSRESLFTKNLNDQLVWDVMFGVKSLLSKDKMSGLWRSNTLGVRTPCRDWFAWLRSQSFSTSLGTWLFEK